MKHPKGHSSVRGRLVLLSVAACLALGGCADAPDAVADAEEADIEDSAQELKNGIYAGYQKGLLELRGAGGGCTAAMIGPNFAITAAHCIDIVGASREGYFPMTVTYFDPDTQTKRPVSERDESLYAWAIPSWDNPSRGVDYQDDLALIRRNDPWLDTDSSDYLRLNGGTSSGSVDDIYPMNVFGRGYFSNAKDGLGTLRSAPVRLSGSSKHEMHNLEGERGLCQGDSGGPWIGTTSGYLVVAGVTSSSEGIPCAENGGSQYAARVNSRIDWILSKMPSGLCKKYGHYTRCF